MLKPHHISIFKEPFKYQNSVWMIPELLKEVEDESLLEQLSPFLLNTTGLAVKYGYQFIVKDKSLFNTLKNLDLMLYLIAAEEDYFREVPIYFENDWDAQFSLDEIVMLGWTINKFTEPAVLFGDFPITCENNECHILKPELINRWGLIPDHTEAKNIATLNTISDPCQEVWRPLAVYVDKFTLKKLDSLL